MRRMRLCCCAGDANKSRWQHRVVRTEADSMTWTGSSASMKTGLPKRPFAVLIFISPAPLLHTARKRRGTKPPLSSANQEGQREQTNYEGRTSDAPPARRGRRPGRSQTQRKRQAGTRPPGSPKTAEALSHRDPSSREAGEGSPGNRSEARMGAAQSSRDEIRRNLKLEFILAQARGLEGEALFDHMAALTEAKIIGRSRPPSQMSQKSRTPRSRVSSRGSRPGTGRSSSIGSRPGTGQTVRFAKPFNGVTYGGFAIPHRRGGRTRPNTSASSPGTTGARTGRTAASRASGPATRRWTR